MMLTLEAYTPLIFEFPVPLFIVALLFYLLSFLPKLFSLRFVAICNGCVAVGASWLALFFKNQMANPQVDVYERTLFMVSQDSFHTATIFHSGAWVYLLFLHFSNYKLLPSRQHPRFLYVAGLAALLLSNAFLGHAIFQSH